MMTMLKTMMLMKLMKSMSCSNPVKMSMILTTMSFLMMFMMKLNLGSSWMPLILSMLFTGGILIMFMILSSITPNEPMKKMSKSLVLSYILALPMMMNSMKLEQLNSFMMKIKWSLSQKMNMNMVIMMILAYFFSFIYMLTKEELPMRSTY